MLLPKYTFVRNLCFSFGVLVALFCVFPPPDMEQILQLCGYNATFLGPINSTTHVLTEENVFETSPSIQEVGDREATGEVAEAAAEVDSGYLKVDGRRPQPSESTLRSIIRYPLTHSRYS